jgi:hypothetical protein
MIHPTSIGMVDEIFIRFSGAIVGEDALYTKEKKN